MISELPEEETLKVIGGRGPLIAHLSKLSEFDRDMSVSHYYLDFSHHCNIRQKLPKAQPGDRSREASDALEVLTQSLKGKRQRR